MKNQFFKSLFVKQAILTLLFAILLSIFSSSIQLFKETLALQEKTHDSFSYWMKVLNQPLSTAIQQGDTLSIEQQIAPLLNYPGVSHIEVFDGDQGLLAKAYNTQPSDNPLKTAINDILPNFSVFHSPLTLKNAAKDIGSVMIYPDKSQVMAELIATHAEYFINSLVKDIMLASFISLMFYIIVTHPLRQLTRSLSEMADNIHRPLSDAFTRRHRHDELGVLNKTFSQLWEQFNHAHTKLEEVHQQQANMIEYAADAILLLDHKHRILLANATAAKMLGIDQGSLTCLTLEDLSTSTDWSDFSEALKNIQINENKTVEIQLSTFSVDIPVEIHLAKYAVGESNETLLLIRDITERKESQEHIERLAYYDPLTNLPNRQFLLEKLEGYLKQANHRGALILLDLDRFKTINDSLGHNVGDQLLCSVTEFLTPFASSKATLVRVGGDEFAFFLQGLDPDPQKAAFACNVFMQKIVDACQRVRTVGVHEMHISGSVGGSLFFADKSTQTILKQADTALYQAKAQGRNTYALYQDEMQHQVDARLEMEKSLHRAYEQELFELYYQPQLDHHGQLIGMEALIRWQDEERGFISPAEFIPVAEEIGLIIDIGAWVMEQAIYQVSAWQAADQWQDGWRMSINVSPIQFQQADFLPNLEALLDKYQVESRCIDLEITENMLLNDLDSSLEKMNRVKSLGVYLSIDDFGTGYSSLKYLKKLPIDRLKIDQSFVRDLLEDTSDEAIVHAIIAMSKALKIKVLAEGVETFAHFDYLKNIGCLHYQGYFFAKALSAESFVNDFICPLHPTPITGQIVSS